MVQYNTNYTNTFTGQSITPYPFAFQALSISGTYLTCWPAAPEVGSTILAGINNITAALNSTLVLPPANQVSVGYPLFLANVGSLTFSVVDNGGTTSVTNIGSGQMFLLWVSDNSDSEGAWNVTQVCSTTTSSNAAAIQGLGLYFNAGTGRLDTEIPMENLALEYSILDNDRGTFFVWLGGPENINLLPSAVNGFYFSVTNLSPTNDAVTLVPSEGGTINGQLNWVVSKGESATIVTDGTGRWYTLGFGKETFFSANLLQKDVSGDSDITLNAQEVSRLIQQYSGELTGNINIIIPSAVNYFMFYNGTSGSYTLSIKTASGTPLAIVQGSRVIMYCDGTEVYRIPTEQEGAPVDATYILKTPDPTLPFAQALSTLPTGILVNDTATGILSTTGVGLVGQFIGTDGTNPVFSYLNAQFLVQVADASVPNAKVLSELDSGVLINETGTGAVTSSGPGLTGQFIGTDGTKPIFSYLNAKFITQTANPSVPNAQNLSALPTGLLLNTTGTGVLTTSGPGTLNQILYTTTDNAEFRDQPIIYYKTTPRWDQVGLNPAIQPGGSFTININVGAALLNIIQNGDGFFTTSGFLVLNFSFGSFLTTLNAQSLSTFSARLRTDAGVTAPLVDVISAPITGVSGEIVGFTLAQSLSSLVNAAATTLQLEIQYASIFPSDGTAVLRFQGGANLAVIQYYKYGLVT